MNLHPHYSTIVMAFMIIFLVSIRVGQFAKKNRSEPFVCSFVLSRFPVAGNHGMRGSQPSQSDSAPPSFPNDCANGHQSTQNITTKFRSAEEGFMFGIGMLLPGPVPLHHSANLTQ